jgi:allophanate hydrolase subunit 1
MTSWRYLGDSCISIGFDEKIDPAINARCVAMAERLLESRRPGIRDVVPTYNAVTVHFDPLQVAREELSLDLEVLALTHFPDPPPDREPITIPVRRRRVRPDLRSGRVRPLFEQQVIELHVRKVRVHARVSARLCVYGSVDSRIAMPRLDSPRLRIPQDRSASPDRRPGCIP